MESLQAPTMLRLTFADIQGVASQGLRLRRKRSPSEGAPCPLGVIQVDAESAFS